jgi:protein TonB
MEANKITNAAFLDILFDGRNKDYGAYELRKSYNGRIAIAITSVAAICFLFFLSQILANDGDKSRRVIPTTVIKLDPLKETELKKSEPLPVQPPKAEPIDVQVKRFTPPVIVEDDKALDPPPIVTELDNSKIGLADKDGGIDDSFVAPPVEKGTGIVEAPKKVEEDLTKIFYKVEKEARFPGGLEAWKKFLERNLNANVAADNGAPIGSYTVKVQFIVDREGVISNVQAIEVPKACPGCGAEAVKVIKKGPNWEPAIQNDRKVNYQAMQFITFQVAEE